MSRESHAFIVNIKERINRLFTTSQNEEKLSDVTDIDYSNARSSIYIYI